jgi:hypothetical protein
MPEATVPPDNVQRFPWRSPLWTFLNILPLALAAITAKVFGSASIALVRTTLAAPPSERYADLGLALIAIATVVIVAVVGVVFFQLMLAPGWKHPRDTFEIHPDRLVVVENNTRREIPWASFSSEPGIDNSGIGENGFAPKRTLVYAIVDQTPLRIPDGHLQQREIAAAIAKARAAHAASRNS